MEPEDFTIGLSKRMRLRKLVVWWTVMCLATVVLFYFNVAAAFPLSVGDIVMWTHIIDRIDELEGWL